MSEQDYVGHGRFSDHLEVPVHYHAKRDISALGMKFEILHAALAFNKNMGQPSTQASNAIIYLTYGTFLSVLIISWFNSVQTLIHKQRRVLGLYVAWSWRRQTKSEFLAANRTQKGQ